MNHENKATITDDLMCLEQTIDGTLWRFYYQNINGQWLRCNRVKVELTH